MDPKIKPCLFTLFLLILFSFNTTGAGDLQLAIEKGDLETVKKHLDRDAELLNKGDEEGKTPPHCVIEVGTNDIAKEIKQGSREGSVSQGRRRQGSFGRGRLLYHAAAFIATALRIISRDSRRGILRISEMTCKRESVS